MMNSYPTFEKVFEQLKTEFPEAQVLISDEELKKLSRILSDTFEEMKKTEYKGFSKLQQPEPCVILHRWQNAVIRDERKYYAKDYNIRVEKFKEVEIHIVNVWAVKRIELLLLCQ